MNKKALKRLNSTGIDEIIFCHQGDRDSKKVRKNGKDAFLCTVEFMGCHSLNCSITSLGEVTANNLCGF
jgi:hypothetical protein